MDTAELADRARELRQARERVDQLASAITHDLQGSLRHISAFADILNEELAEQVSDEQREMLSIITAKADELREQVRLVFLFMRDSSKVEPQPVNADAALEAASTTLSEDIAATEATITSDPLPNVVADPVLLSKILENLLRNALQHNARKPVIHVSSAIEGGEAAILVEDNGTGIDARYHANIFKPFWSLTDGAGLGLTFCQKVLDALGGSIDLVRSDASGSLFRIRLPLA